MAEAEKKFRILLSPSRNSHTDSNPEHCGPQHMSCVVGADLEVRLHLDCLVEVYPRDLKCVSAVAAVHNSKKNHDNKTFITVPKRPDRQIKTDT